MTFIADTQRSGIEPLQHQQPQWPLDMRLQRLGVRVKRGLDDAERGVYDTERDACGPIIGWHLWPVTGKGDRQAPAWAQAWPAVMMGEKVAAPQRADETDPDFKDLEVSRPFANRYPVGWPGVVLAGTDQDEQHDLFVPGFPGLVAASVLADSTSSSWVFDPKNGELDPSRRAQVHSAWKVYGLPVAGVVAFGGTGRNHGLAWQLGGAADGTAGLGVVVGGSGEGIGNTVDPRGGGRGIYAAAAAYAGGPFEVGGAGDPHQLARTSDGAPVNSLHLGTSTLFKRGADDASLEFGGEYVEARKFPFLAETYLRYDRKASHDWVGGPRPGRWRWQTTVPFAIVEPIPRGRYVDPIPRGGDDDDDDDEDVVRRRKKKKEDDTGPRGEPPLPPKLPGGPLGPGVDEEALPPRLPGGLAGGSSVETGPAAEGLPGHLTPADVQRLLRRRTTLRKVGGRRRDEPLLYTTMDLAAPALVARPQHLGTGAWDLRYDARGEAVREAARDGSLARAPAVAALVAWGAQRGDRWAYQDRPGDGRYAGGTAAGGFVLLPPQVGLEDTAPPGVTRTTAYLTTLPGLSYLAHGTPDTATGGVVSGFRLGATTSDVWRLDDLGATGAVNATVPITVTKSTSRVTLGYGLTVAGITSTGDITIDKLLPALILDDDTGDDWHVRNSAGTLEFYDATDASAYVSVFENGNVTVGTSAVSNKFTVGGIIRSHLTTGGLQGTSREYASAAPIAGDVLGNLFFAGENTSPVQSGTAATIVAAVDATGGSRIRGRLVFSTSDGTTVTERMRIDSSGLMGINTTGPDRRLDVLDASNPQLRLTYTDGAVYSDFQTNASGFLIVTPSGGSIQTPNGGTSNPAYSFTNDPDVGMYYAASTLLFAVAGVDKFWADATTFTVDAIFDHDGTSFGVLGTAPATQRAHQADQATTVDFNGSWETQYTEVEDAVEAHAAAINAILVTLETYGFHAVA